MMISTDPTFTGESLRTFYQRERFDISGGDGEKKVHVRVMDNAGVYGDAHDTIVLDTTPPKGTLKINNNAASTITSTVNLTLSASDKNGVVEMMLSNRDTFNNSVWEPFVETRIWEIAEGEGERFVFVKFKDPADLVSEIASDGIARYELSKNDTVVINNGDDYTNDRNVSIELGLGGMVVVSEMMVTDTGSFNDSEWSYYEETLAWELPEGDGEKIITVKFRNPYGIETEAFFDTIILDTTPPSVKFMEPENGTSTFDKVIDVWGRIDDASGVEKVEIQIDAGTWEEADINTTDPTKWEAVITLMGTGPHEIAVRATDNAGNTAEDYLYIEIKKKKDGGPMPGAALILIALSLALLIASKSRKRKQ
jgi:hypothetical protein